MTDKKSSKSEPREASPAIPPSRQVALSVLGGVLRQRRFLDDVLSNDAHFQKLDPRDRGFVHNLVASCLRGLGEVDALINQCLDRPLPQKASIIQDVLRLGIAQLLYTDTPEHAAVDTAVSLAHSVTNGAHVKLVNAILRRVTRESDSLRSPLDPVRLNTPDWLWTLLCEDHGAEQARAIAVAQTVGPAPLDLSCKANPADWAERLNGQLVGMDTVRIHNPGSVSHLPGYAEGEWWVQDAAATLPVHLLGDVQGKRVLDLCAAPGGKTAQLVARGAQVTALDRNPKRMVRLEENLARLGLSAELIVADALSWSPDAPFDTILLDAPCSATGTIRRHPELPWIKDGRDIEKLVHLQAQLLDKASEWVKPGGILTYVTCSLLKAEGDAQISQFLQRHSGFKPNRPTSASLADWCREDGTLRTLPSDLPDRGGTDGFFACSLQKS